MWTLPDDLEDALWAAAAESLPADALRPNALAAAIAERTRRYTSERERLGEPVPPGERARDLAARALFFGVADASKVGIPVAELSGRGLVPPRDPLRVLDLGAGAGAMTLGLAAALADRRLDVTAVDRDAAALALLERAARHAGRPLAVRTVVADLTAAAAPAAASAALAAVGPYDLIVAGTVLNELSPAARLPLARDLLERRLADDGALLFVEPALRATARALHELRDALLAAGVGHVFAPCTRAGAPCPALADPDDWCHEDRPFRPPPRLAQLARATGLRQGGLKFAYLTLRRAPAPLVEPPPGARALRVVSGPLDAKGTIERVVCGEDGRVRLRVLRRDRDDSNRALGQTRRGDVLVVDAAGALARHRPADDLPA